MIGGAGSAANSGSAALCSNKRKDLSTGLPLPNKANIRPIPIRESACLCENLKNVRQDRIPYPS